MDTVPGLNPDYHYDSYCYYYVIGAVLMMSAIIHIIILGNYVVHLYYQVQDFVPVCVVGVGSLLLHSWLHWCQFMLTAHP